MTELRELTNAELDIVGGGARPKSGPTQGCGGGIEELIVDILKILEGNSCNNNRKPVAA